MLTELYVNHQRRLNVMKKMKKKISKYFRVINFSVVIFLVLFINILELGGYSRKFMTRRKMSDIILHMLEIKSSEKGSMSVTRELYSMSACVNTMKVLTRPVYD